MSLEERMAIGMPPDGVGKHFNVDYSVELTYSSATASFVVGSEVVGGTSGRTGTIVRVKETGPSVGQLFLILPPDDLGLDFTVGEDLLVDSVVIATVATVGQPLYSQRAQIVGGNNPFNAQFVDRQGAAAVRFAEGSTQFDGFGRMVVSEPRTLGDYQMTYWIDPKMWFVEEISGGAVTHIPDKVGAMLSTGLASGDIARITTQAYHVYQAGTGQLILLTGFCEDAGKAGVVRRWGYFDDEDGIFFQVVSTGLQAVIRSSTSGTVVETVIDQADWNTDRLDGSGPSQFVLDVTKHNLYWIDFAWLGIGAIRFGVYGDDGARIVAHTVRNANVHNAPYMKTARLPIRYEMENTGNPSTATEMFASCCAVKMEGQFEPRHRPFGDIVPEKTVTGTDYTPIFGVRASATKYGEVSRVIALPHTMQVLATLTGTNNPAKVRLRVQRGDGGLTGMSWIGPSADETVDLDVSATGVATGETVLSSIVMGERKIDLEEQFDLFADERLSLRSDGTSVPYFVTVQPVNPADSVDINIAVNWTEV